jgi:hypothetical protein
MKYQVVIFVLLLVGITSCTKVIQVNVPKGSNLLVVDAFLSNSTKPQTVRLTFNANYFSNVPTPAVNGATVSLNDLTNAKTYTFTPDGSGNYIYTPVVNDSMAQLNHTYQLNIIYNGNSYIALSTLYQTIKVDSIAFRSTSTDAYGQYPNDTTSPRAYYPYIFAKDIEGQENFYWAKTYKNNILYGQPGQMNFFQDAGDFAPDGDYVGVPNNFFGLIDNKDPYHKGDVCDIEIYSINENTIDFLLQLQTQMTNSQAGLFAVTPQNIKTNIKQVNGTQQAIGWFNMGAISSKSQVVY